MRSSPGARPSPGWPWIPTALLLALTARPEVAQQAPQGAEAPQRERPSVVWIVADDLGVGDLSSNGGSIPTPRLDQLARSGVVFTQAYTVSPLCAPSRAGLLTGRHPSRLGLEANPGPDEDTDERPWGLADDVPTVPALLRAQGYRTACIGKWHLGRTASRHPLERGFDEFFGFLPGAHVYTADDPRSANPDNPILRQREPVEEAQYLTDAFAREAVAFLERQEGPFFLYLAFNAPHQPFQAPAEAQARFADRPEAERVYAAMVSQLDSAVGRVLDALERLERASDTLVVFVSDNGAPEALDSNGDLRGGKLLLFEGGLRVPMSVRWPGRVRPGTRIDTPVSFLDLAPTVTHLAGLSSQVGFEGQDLAPLWRGEPFAERALYWRYGPSAAVLRDGLKLVTSRRSRWLFDLDRDPGEEHDLVDERSEAAEALERDLERWSATLGPPAPSDGKPLHTMVLGKPYFVPR